MVSSLPPTSAEAPSAAVSTSRSLEEPSLPPEPPLRPISSSLYGSAASSSRACSSVTTRRRKDCPSLTIFCITFSRPFRSSGVNGRSTSKS